MSILFKQNPKEKNKYKPDESTRKIEKLTITRKQDLEKFRTWLEGTAEEKSDLPDKKELDKLNKEATKGKGVGLGLLGVLAAIPVAALAFGGGFKGLTNMASDARSFISGGGKNDQSGGFFGKLFGGFGSSNTSVSATTATATASSSTSLLPTLPTIQSPTLPSASSSPSAPRPTVVVAAGTNSAEDPNQAAADVADIIKKLQGKARVVIVPPDNESSQFSPAHNAIVGAAQAHGAIIEPGQYGGDTGNDRMHLTPESASAIRARYPNAIFLGDSNATRLAGGADVPGVRETGAGTGDILQYAQNLPTPSNIGPTPAGPSPLQNVVPVENFTGVGVGGGDVGLSAGGLYDTQGTINSRGRPHYGIDIGTSGQTGYFVAFTIPGQVQDAGWFYGYGYTVVLTCSGKDYLFGHLKTINVKKGDAYNGEVIGEIGKTGRPRMTEHLHFEVSPPGTGGYDKEATEDPMPYTKYLRIGKQDPNNKGGRVGTLGSVPHVQGMLPQNQQQGQPNIWEKMLSSIMGMFKGAYGFMLDMISFMNDEEAVANTVLWDDVVKGNQSEATNTSKSNQGGNDFNIFEMISSVPNNSTVLDFNEAIRAAQNNNDIFILDGGGGNPGPQSVPVGGGGGGGQQQSNSGGSNSSTVLIGTMNARDIHKMQVATRIG